MRLSGREKNAKKRSAIENSLAGGGGTSPKGITSADDLPGGDSAPDTFEELEKASRKGSIFGKFNARFHDVLQSSRGDDRTRDPNKELGRMAHGTADDLAIRRAKGVNMKRMTVPEGVIIDGSLMSGSETEISGRIQGDVTVEGKLFLGASALVTGNVRATYCRVEGMVEGKVECSEELDLGQGGRLNADTMAGKKITVAGQISGNVSCGGLLNLVASGKITGDIRAKRLLIEEGAVLNGSCRMRTPVQRTAVDPTASGTPADPAGA